MIDFETEVTNAGTAPAKAVVLTNKLPAELQFSNSDPSVTGDQMGVVTWNLGDMAPGQTRRVRCTVIPKSVGKFTMQAEARAAVGVNGKASRAVAVGEPKLSLVATGPKSRLVNRPATYLITVSNPGTMALTNVVVTTEITEGMALQSATGGALISNRRTRVDKRLDREVSYQDLRWSLGRWLRETVGCSRWCCRRPTRGRSITASQRRRTATSNSTPRCERLSRN